MVVLGRLGVLADVTFLWSRDIIGFEVHYTAHAGLDALRTGLAFEASLERAVVAWTSAIPTLRHDRTLSSLNYFKDSINKPPRHFLCCGHTHSHLSIHIPENVLERRPDIVSDPYTMLDLSQHAIMQDACHLTILDAHHNATCCLKYGTRLHPR